VAARGTIFPMPAPVLTPPKLATVHAFDLFCGNTEAASTFTVLAGESPDAVHTTIAPQVRKTGIDIGHLEPYLIGDTLLRYGLVESVPSEPKEGLRLTPEWRSILAVAGLVLNTTVAFDQDIGFLLSGGKKEKFNPSVPGPASLGLSLYTQMTNSPDSTSGQLAQYLPYPYPRGVIHTTLTLLVNIGTVEKTVMRHPTYSIHAERAPVIADLLERLSPLADPAQLANYAPYGSRLLADESALASLNRVAEAQRARRAVRSPGGESSGEEKEKEILPQTDAPPPLTRKQLEDAVKAAKGPPPRELFLPPPPPPKELVMTPSGAFPHDWRLSGHCYPLDPEDMFPLPGDTAAIEKAKRVCEGCPPSLACLKTLVDSMDSHAVGGGFTGPERLAQIVNLRRLTKDVRIEE
jgi:WhiB family transcriptional regulator, redox-sensing transcriptional regulator